MRGFERLWWKAPAAFDASYICHRSAIINAIGVTTWVSTWDIWFSSLIYAGLLLPLLLRHWDIIAAQPQYRALAASILLVAAIRLFDTPYALRSSIGLIFNGALYRYFSWYHKAADFHDNKLLYHCTQLHASLLFLLFYMQIKTMLPDLNISFAFWWWLSEHWNCTSITSFYLIIFEIESKCFQYWNTFFVVDGAIEITSRGAAEVTHWYFALNMLLNYDEFSSSPDFIIGTISLSENIEFSLMLRMLVISR